MPQPACQMLQGSEGWATNTSNPHMLVQLARLQHKSQTGLASKQLL